MLGGERHTKWFTTASAQRLLKVGGCQDNVSRLAQTGYTVGGPILYQSRRRRAKITAKQLPCGVVVWRLESRDDLSKKSSITGGNGNQTRTLLEKNRRHL